MRMSTKAQYAVRALVSLNLTSRGAPVSIKEISEHENISLNYLEQLFVKLRRGDIVKVFEVREAVMSWHGMLLKSRLTRS